MSMRVDRFTAVITRQQQRFRIEDTLSFVEDAEFLAEFRECGMDDEDLDLVQVVITACPTGGYVVPVTTNVRDLFYSNNNSSVVVRYAYLEAANTVLLLTAYEGTSSLSMTAGESAEAEHYIGQQVAYFQSRYTR